MIFYRKKSGANYESGVIYNGVTYKSKEEAEFKKDIVDLRVGPTVEATSFCTKGEMKELSLFGKIN